jgi:hypothetical protein
LITCCKETIHTTLLLPEKEGAREGVERESPLKRYTPFFFDTKIKENRIKG